MPSNANISYYTVAMYKRFTYIHAVPIDSAPPGHFWLTILPLVASGQKMFHSVSVSCEHIEVSKKFQLIHN